MGKFDSIDDLRDYVQEYLTIHNMSTDDLMTELKECIKKLDFSIEDSISNVNKINNEANKLEDELNLLKYLLNGKK